MEASKSKTKIILAAAILLLLIASVAAVIFLWPKTLYAGYYSAVNENRAPVSASEFVRDLYVEENQSGRLTTCDLSGNPVDIIRFAECRIRGNQITFYGVEGYRELEDRNFAAESDGGCSLTLSFSLKDGGFVLGDCHYERLQG